MRKSGVCFQPEILGSSTCASNEICDVFSFFQTADFKKSV